MSKQLIESIIDDNLVSAKDIFIERMEEILECKLYEEKRRISAEMNEGMVSLGLSRKEMKKREEAGYLPAHKVLGLSPYDIGKEEKEKRLAARAKEHKAKKKVGKKSLEEMRAPGEVPGSEERTKQAQNLRLLRKGLKLVGVSKSDKGKYFKDYLAARRAQIGSKTGVTDTETPTKTEPQAAPQVDTTPRQMPKLDKEKTPRDMSRALFLKKPKELRKADAPRNMDIINRYRSGLERAKDLQTRGSEGAVRRFKKAYGVKAMPAQAASGLSIIKRGLQHIADS